MRPVAPAASTIASSAHVADAATSMSAGQRRREVVAGDVQPGEDPAVEAGGAQRDGLGLLGDAEPGRTAGLRGAGRLEEAVAVAVGLDDGHELGRGRPLVERA